MDVKTIRLRGKETKKVFQIVEKLHSQNETTRLIQGEHEIVIEHAPKVRIIDNMEPDKRPLRREKKQHGRTDFKNPNGNIYALRDKVDRDPFKEYRTPKPMGMRPRWDGAYFNLIYR